MAMGKIYRSTGKSRPRKARLLGKPKRTRLFKKIVNRAIKYAGESKYLNTLVGTTYIDYNGTLQCLSLVPQGSTDVTRIGDKLMPTSLDICGHFVLPQTLANRPYSFVRMIIFRWLQDTDDTNPTVSDIVDYAGSDQVVLTSPVHDKRPDFNILYDSGPKMVSPLLTAGQTLHLNLKMRLKLAGKEISFVGASTSGRNHIYALFLADVPATYNPYVRMFSRLNFKD